MSDVQSWWASGERLRLAVGNSERSIFVKRLGAGPSITLLHGFPSSSHDWAKIAPELASSHALLLPDFLGFGASEKPSGHEYTLHEQADLVEACWAAEGIAETTLVGHDYAVSVVQELLARRAEGSLTVELRAVHLLNGGLYPELHRPLATQSALLDPEQGPRISALLDRELFITALSPTFADGYDAAADSADIWEATCRDDGHRIAHLLIRYIRDRELHGARWVAALETSDVPMFFVWGMLDPISGAHMADRIRERMPEARFEPLAEVAHWPALEAPGRVAALLHG